MIAQIFNSSLISGPETLILPNLKFIKSSYCIIWLKEVRVEEAKNEKVLAYFKQFAEVHVIPVTSRRDTKAAAQLKAKLEELNIKIAHAHDVKATYILDLSGASNKYKRISTHHGVHARSGLSVVLFEQFYSRFILPQMDKTITVCSTDKPILVDRGIAPEKIIVHLNGVDRPKINWEERSALQETIRKSWGITTAPAEKLYGIVARLADEKDHALALRCLARLKDLSFKVLCFGLGPEEVKLKALTKELGLEDKVIWMGYRGSLGQELAGFDGLLSFSRAEGLPINMIEAGWASTPIFARVVDGVADLIPDKEFGFPFPMDEKLEKMETRFREFYSDTGEKQARNMLTRIESNFSGKSWAKQMDKIVEVLG